MNKWSRDMACVVQWRRDECSMQSMQSSAWWESGATPVPWEGPKWSRLTMLSQGISWLNHPTCTYTHMHTHTHTHVQSCTELSGSDWVLRKFPNWSQSLGFLQESIRAEWVAWTIKGLGVLWNNISHMTSLQSHAISRYPVNTVKPFLSYSDIVT